MGDWLVGLIDFIGWLRQCLVEEVLGCMFSLLVGWSVGLLGDELIG